MDLLTIDVSDLPDGAVQPGQYVDLIGPTNDIDRFAASAGTVGYEILTSLGTRYARRYLPDRPSPDADGQKSGASR
jgi:alanine racemase